LGGALVRMKEITNEDYSTVFLFNLAISIAFFLSLIFSSGLIANYYNDIRLQPLICVSSIIIIINAFNVVQNARIYREMKFKINLYINITSVVLSSSIGLYLAFKGFGVWSLVVMNLILVFSKTVLLWISEGGVGKLSFNVISFKGLYRYGVFVTLISFFNTAFDNIYQLLLGRYFSIKQVGYFYQGKKMQGVPFFILNSLTLGVIFSHLANFQTDNESFQKEYLKIHTVFSIAIAALGSLIFLLARHAVQLVLGNVWLESVVYIKLLTIASFFLLLKVYCQNICKVFNRTEKIFIWELVAIALQIVTIVVGIVMKSIFITLSGAIVSNLIAYLITSIYSWRLLGLTGDKEMASTAKIVIASCIGVVVAAQIDTMNINVLLQITLMPVVFVLIYLGLLKILRVFDWRDIMKYKLLN